jgi:hypothetical protein
MDLTILKVSLNSVKYINVQKLISISINVEDYIICFNS